jgi:GNAT superfamily N-acetyltransferase
MHKLTCFLLPILCLSLISTCRDEASRKQAPAPLRGASPGPVESASPVESAAPGTTASTPSGSPAAYCHVVDDPAGHGLAGFALWCLNVSTWTGRHGIYLEDLYVRESARGRGVGKALLARIARLAVERNCGRLEWAVLDWNEPAIGFYRRLGAEPMADWTVFRLTGPALAAVADLAC